MARNILVVSATSSEADALKRIPGLELLSDRFIFRNKEISVLVTGVGSVATSWAMTKWFSSGRHPDLAINIGIAGSYKEDFNPGDVVVPVSDCFADAGIEEGDVFKTLMEAGLEDHDMFPFAGGIIRASNQFTAEAVKVLRPVKAITVNTATGSQPTIDKLMKKFSPDIETMEGAAFFYICSREKIPFVALRAISNMVEPRNRKNWKVPLALESLSQKLADLILKLE